MIKPHPQNKNRHTNLLLGAACAAVLSLSGTAHAQVIVPSSVNFDIGTGLFTYSYSVTNNGPTFDLAIVNVPVGPGSNLMSLTAPTGFDISYDPGVNLVSFFEDSDPLTVPTFSPGTTKGFFTYTSTYAPATVTFDALDANGDSFTGPTQSATVPEPGTFSLIGLGLLAPALLARRRSRQVYPIQSDLNP